jgi:hypothetical protein
MLLNAMKGLKWLRVHLEEQTTTKQEYFEIMARFLYAEDIENIQKYNISFLHRIVSYEAYHFQKMISHLKNFQG